MYANEKWIAHKIMLSPIEKVAAAPSQPVTPPTLCQTIPLLESTINTWEVTIKICQPQMPVEC
jgi:hypothetical protein